MADLSVLRESINLNREWKFQLGDVAGAEATAFDDANWNDANLPGGRTVIRATSPGLPEATLEITTKGGPQIVVGKTLEVRPRPYVRFAGANDTVAIVTVGRENPTRTSSEAPSHSGRLANDGNPATFWQAAAGETNAWLRVDLEKIVAVKLTKLMFPTEGNWRYKIEISEDGETGLGIGSRPYPDDECLQRAFGPGASQFTARPFPACDRHRYAQPRAGGFGGSRGDRKAQLAIVVFLPR